MKPWNYFVGDAHQIKENTLSKFRSSKEYRGWGQISLGSFSSHFDRLKSLADAFQQPHQEVDNLVKADNWKSGAEPEGSANIGLIKQ